MTITVHSLGTDDIDGQHNQLPMKPFITNVHPIDGTLLAFSTPVVFCFFPCNPLKTIP